MTLDGVWLGSPNPALILALALALDAAIGDPPRLWRLLPHPVVVMGGAVKALDRGLNRGGTGRRRWAGIAAALMLLAGAAGLGFGLAWLLGAFPFGWLLEVAAVAVLLAGHSLHDHVGAVADGLARGGIEGGREAVRHIVGRDPARLDESGISRAALESLAENLSDGVVAPALWYLAFGLPGLLAYKTLNTADSMIGHRSQRHAAFGWAAARLDDAANLVPARATALLIAAVAGGHRRACLHAMWRDARHHRSPNAGWPEAAMAAALDLALAGPRPYGGREIADHWMNAGGRRSADANDIRKGLAVSRRAQLLFAAGATLVGLLGLTMG